MRALPQLPRPRRSIAAAALVVALALSGAAIFYGLSDADDPKAAQPEPSPSSTAEPATPTSVPTASPTPSPTPVKWASPLNGAPLTEDEWNARSKQLPLAVMIDNTPGALPHVGLDKADLVYEAFVEGGITRFMAVYWSQDAGLIMPVRSARTPFVIWVDELGATYAHAGGADTTNDADAMGQIYAWDILDLNAFTSGPGAAYYRDTGRAAPYNLGTATHWLRDAAEQLGFVGPPQVEPWPFKADGEATAQLAAAEALQITFQERYPWQPVQWRWDAASRSYARFQFKGPFVDGATREQIRARNVVVMRVPSRVVDASGHVLLDQFGKGEVTIFLDGKAIPGAWQKADRRGRTRFFDASGNEIAFNRGPIWIEVLGPASSLLVAESGASLPPFVP